MSDFSQNASAFNCRLIAFKKFDISRVRHVQFPHNYSIKADDSCL